MAETADAGGGWAENTMIQVKNLSKRYGSHLAVDRINFHLEPGQILGFLGPNGAGKSTTIRILTCYMPASSGDARFRATWSTSAMVRTGIQKLGFRIRGKDTDQPGFRLRHWKLGKLADLYAFLGFV